MIHMVEVIFMTLQGLSTAIIDAFFLMTVIVTFMTVYRFGQFGALEKSPVKNRGELTIELIVQGIVMGALFSLLVVFLGIPIFFSEYLYFLLPMSFLIGFYHIKYTNLIYSATVLAIISIVMRGQMLGDITLPDVDVSLPGLAVVTGLLMLLVGLLMLMTGAKHMTPIVVMKENKKILGFGIQRFWPIPIVILVAVEMIVVGETVPMPDWWPMLRLYGTDVDSTSLFMLPLLMVLNQGSISFSQVPEAHIKVQTQLQVVSGLVLATVGYIGSGTGHMDILVLVAMLGVAVAPEVLWRRFEEKKSSCFELNGNGVYIVNVVRGTQAKINGFQRGDCIIEVNDQPVGDYANLLLLCREVTEEHVVKIRRHGMENITINTGRRDLLSESFGLTCLTKVPKKVHDYDNITHMNMMHLMRYNFKKDDSE